MLNYWFHVDLMLRLPGLFLRWSQIRRVVVCMVLFLVCAVHAPAEAPPTANHSKLPRWRGFNLQEKFNIEWSNSPYQESDFRLISQWGFNFVRLPMDYRTWIVNGDWNVFNEPVLKEIDEAIRWGAAYGIHVNLNFHRAPGYTVMTPPEPTSLWKDRETQEVFARHWAMFARRYKGIGNQYLSFNLINEPSGVDASTYLRVVDMALQAIRAEDPERLIICDGLDHGRTPVGELVALNVAQATRGYTPFELTHYHATWVGDTSWMVDPAWPRLIASGNIYGANRPSLNRPMMIIGPFTEPATLRMHIEVVSDSALLLVRGDENVLFQHHFIPGYGKGEWKEVIFNEEWNIFQNRYDRDYRVAIPAGTERVTLEVTSGDWLRLGHIGIRSENGSAERKLTLSRKWGVPPPQLVFKPENPEQAFKAELTEDRECLWHATMEPWQAFVQKHDIGVMVGEWGAFNRTSHEVVLRWAEDCLINWQKAGWGWALWNFRGPFGIIDSGRDDVDYEEHEGHKLDRKFLELLQRY